MSDTWLILGASSAIARAFALAAARDSDLILAGRDLDDMERTAADIRIRTGRAVRVESFDAADRDSHRDFAEGCRIEGRLNVFLAFGLMPPQEEMERDFATLEACVAVNYLGAVSILSRLAPLLEAKGDGLVAVLGSVAGDRGRLKNHVYGSAKAGLHCWLEGFRARMFRKGVSVTTVKPGFVDTAMTWGEIDSPLMASPEAFAEAVLKAAGNRREVVYVPFFWRFIMLIIRHVPERIFKRTNI